MSNVYYTDIKNANDINSQLASVAYVNESIKLLKDVLTKILNKPIQYSSYIPDIKKLPEKEVDLNNEIFNWLRNPYHRIYY